MEEQLRYIAEKIVGNVGITTENMRFCTVTGQEFIQVTIKFKHKNELLNKWRKWIKAYKSYATYVADPIINSGGSLTLHWRILPMIIDGNYMRARLLITFRKG